MLSNGVDRHYKFSIYKYAYRCKVHTTWNLNAKHEENMKICVLKSKYWMSKIRLLNSNEIEQERNKKKKNCQKSQLHIFSLVIRLGWWFVKFI